jgi:ferredoxin, 2Fe-2S
MVRILIRNLGKSLTVMDLSKTLLRHVQDHHVDWMHSCGGKGRCTTCKAVVVEGLQNLEADTPAELRYRQKGLLADNERLACQVRVLGECTVAVPEESKLPHMHYLD